MPWTEADEVAANMSADLLTIYTLDDALRHVPPADEVGYQVRDNMAEALLNRARAFRAASLVERVKQIAPGFYTERDGGYWYIVTPDHGDRIGEDFRNRDDARRFLLWCAGESLPEGWSIGEVKRIAADVECGQGFPATAWVRAIAKHFPARAAELTAEG